MMHQLFGHLAFLWATLLAVPLSLVVTAVLFAVWRWSPIQRVCMPGADECRMLEAFVHARCHRTADELGHESMAALAQLGHGILIRNGLNAIALALVFFVVMTASHALLMAL